MEKSLYTTLQLASCLLAIVAIAWLVMKYLTPKCSCSDKVPEDRASSAKSCRIHLCYLVGIGSLLLIELVSYILTHTGQFSDIFDQISLAATISSILLSVLAIIYAIVSGSKGETLYQKTEEVSKQIGETLPKFESLDAVVTALRKIPSDIDAHLASIKERMLSVEDYSRKTYQKVTSMSESPDGVANGSGSILRSQPIEGTATAKTEGRDVAISILRAYVSNSSFWGKLLLLACCYAKETKKPFPLTDSLFKEENFPAEYLYGYLIASNALGLVNSSKNEDDTWSIKEVYASDGFPLKDLVTKELEHQSADDSVPPAVKEGRLQNLKDVKAYFGIN